MREQAAVQVDRLRSEAEEYAKQVRESGDDYAHRRKVEIDCLVAQAEEHARTRAAAIMDNARDEVKELVREQMTIGEALNRAAIGIEASRDALARLSKREDGDASSSRRRSMLPPPVALSVGAGAPIARPPEPQP